MKKKVITLFALFVSFLSFSQNDRLENREKIQALKVAYITEQLDLSTSEAEKFWPIYNTFEEEQHRLRQSSHDKREDINFDTLTESESQKLLDEMIAINKERISMYDTYILNLRKVLPAKKIILLKKVENEFKQKMFEEYRKRKGTKSRNRP
ncbi:sensor of ECF-type sigma factor [Lacinutrix iliipiscaria]|uniref:Sensor of ECF-type sigma factor n=1 Tax=Lacinutrix iliipiscaria TaxID=1230532 RepID=A0ABW5WNK2_9FLAO